MRTRTLTRGLSALFALIAGLCLGAGFLRISEGLLADLRLPFAAGFALFGALWALARRRWLSDLCFLALAFGVGLAAFYGAPFGWPLAAACAALLAWDLYDFSLRLGQVITPQDRQALTRRHLAWLGAALGLGLLLAEAALLLQFDISFWPAAALAILGIGGLLQAALWMKRTQV